MVGKPGANQWATCIPSPPIAMAVSLASTRWNSPLRASVGQHVGEEATTPGPQLEGGCRVLGRQHMQFGVRNHRKQRIVRVNQGVLAHKRG